MKKNILTVVLLMAALIGYSQASKRTTAYNYHRQGKLDKAKEAIDEAVQHEKTIGDAKTWFYRGNIYYEIAVSPDTLYQKLSDDPLAVALESYNKTIELDEKDNFTEDANKMIKAIAEAYYNLGVLNYNESQYTDAAKSFEEAYIVNQQIGKYDTVALFNAAVSANLGDNLPLAIKYYEQLDELNFEKPEIYSALGELYKTQGDTLTGLAYIQKGREKFPNDFNLLIAETNVYLAQNQTEMALGNLEQAIEQDRTNPTIFFAVGANYDQLGMFEKAEGAYRQAIELNEDYFEANYNLGALYVNRAAELLQEANDLPLEEVDKYEELKQRADDLLERSIPYLEKALELNPEDVNTMVSLKEIYTRLKMMDKIEEIDAKMNDR